MLVFEYPVDSSLFARIRAEDVIQVKRDYQAQTPCLWDQGMSNDPGLLYMLAVGRVHGFDYLR